MGEAKRRQCENVSRAATIHHLRDVLSRFMAGHIRLGMRPPGGGVREWMMFCETVIRLSRTPIHFENRACALPPA